MRAAGNRSRRRATVRALNTLPFSCGIEAINSVARALIFARVGKSWFTLRRLDQPVAKFAEVIGIELHDFPHDIVDEQVIMQSWLAISGNVLRVAIEPGLRRVDGTVR